MQTLKVVGLMTGLTLLMVGAGQYFGGSQGAVMMFGFAALMNLGSYWFSDTVVLKMYRAQVIDRAQAPELYGMVERLAQRANLPMPVVGREGGSYRWLDERDFPESIGRLSAFMGNTGVLLRAWVYMRILGAAGMRRVAEYSALNANYLLARLVEAGFEAAYPGRRASHEFIVTLKREAREFGVTAMDFAERLLDHGYHAPTTYFPLLVPECLLVEPTESETREELDGFVEALAAIRREAQSDAATVKAAPHTMPVRRLDDVRAARQLDVAWKPAAPE